MSLLAASLVAWVRLVTRFGGLVCVAVAALAAAGLWYAAGHLGVNTDTANMISPSLPWRQDYIAYQQAFPIRDRNLVVVVDALTGPEARDTAVALVSAMTAEPTLFPSVFLPGHGEFFDRNGLLYLDLPVLEELADRLTAAQPLLGRIRLNPTGAGVLDVLAEASENGVGEDLEEFRAAVADVLRSAQVTPAAPAMLDWSALLEPEGTLTTRQVILVQPQLDFTRLRPAREAIERIRQLGASLTGAEGATARIRMTGTLAMEHEELDSVIDSASLAGLLSLVMVAAVLYWSLRSVRLLAVALVTLIAGLALTAALAGFLVGRLNLLSVAFAVLYVGLGVDFILHLILRVRESVVGAEPLEQALRTTVRQIGPSLVLCTLTTAAGFFAFVPTDFDGVSELGLISGTGMFVSLAVSLTLLPALLAVVFRTGMPRRALQPRRRPLWLEAGLKPGPILAVTGLLAVGAAIALPAARFDSNPVNLRDPEAESIRLLLELTAGAESQTLTLVALAQDRAEGQRWQAALSELSVVDRTESVAVLIPPDQDDKRFVLDDLLLTLGPGFSRFTAAAPVAANLRAALARLRAAQSATATPAATQFAAEIAGIESQLAAATAADLAAIDRALLGNLPAELGRLERNLSPGEIDIAALPASLRERWIDPRGRELIEIYPAADVNDFEHRSDFVEAVRGVIPRATGLPVVYYEAGGVVVGAFRQALISAVAAVTVLLLLTLRSWRETLLVLTPILLAALLTAGLTVVFGIPFNFANIIALPLLVGVGVDNAIHMVHRGRNSPDGSALLQSSTSLAVLASGLTTIASFGNLAFSSHQGMASMGALLTLGMLVTMAATLVFLPALLAPGDQR